jgi:hypothetical protein
MERPFHKISALFVGAASPIALPIASLISASLVFCLWILFLSTSFVLASKLLV